MASSGHDSESAVEAGRAGICGEMSRPVATPSHPAALPNPDSASSLGRRVLVMGSLVFVLALGIRVAHANKGLPYMHYWNEPAIASTALEMMKSGDFNPHFFAYGSVPIYLCLMVDIVHFFHLMGQPATADWHLDGLEDIETGLVPDWAKGVPPPWFWRISHPTFLFWNRVLICVFGAASVLVVFLLGERLANEWVGLVAAIFLATQAFHVEMSVQVMPDLPMTCFVTGAVLFSLLYLDGGRTSHLVAALVFSGLAVGTKYNAVLVILAPAMALALRQLGDSEKRRGSHWLLLALVPVATFLVVMPYVLLDLSSFLGAAGLEVRHYRIMGHGGGNVPPGWEHVGLQLANFREQLGLLASLVILGGIPLLYRRRALVVFVVPVAHFVFMTRMRVNFERNFLLLYPFLSLLGALGVYLVYRAAKAAAGRLDLRQDVATWSAVLLALALVLPQTWAVADSAVSTWRGVESRTEAMQSANRLAREQGFSRIVIAEELRVHERDLRRLNAPFVIASVRAMNVCVKGGSQNLYIVPDGLKKMLRSQTPDHKRQMNAHRLLRKRIEDRQILDRVGLGGATWVNQISVDPTILLVRFPENRDRCAW